MLAFLELRYIITFAVVEGPSLKVSVRISEGLGFFGSRSLATHMGGPALRVHN